MNLNPKFDSTHYNFPFLLFFLAIICGCIGRELMNAVNRKVRSFGDAGSHRSIPWRDAQFIETRERKYEKVRDSSNDDVKRKRKMELCKALVHSTSNQDVLRGIQMLEDPLGEEDRKEIYLLAVGHYRNKDYSRSLDYLRRYKQESQDKSGKALILEKEIANEVSIQQANIKPIPSMENKTNGASSSSNSNTTIQLATPQLQSPNQNESNYSDNSASNAPINVENGTTNAPINVENGTTIQPSAPGPQSDLDEVSRSVNGVGKLALQTASASVAAAITGITVSIFNRKKDRSN